MPLLPTPAYAPPLPFRFGHIQTIYPTLFRTAPKAFPVSERLETDDGDFIDVDWHFHKQHSRSKKLVVISHGLEGNSRKKYMLGMATRLNEAGWDVICLNFRGCSGEMNRLPRLYHSGVTDDLHTVLTHGLASGGYRQAALIGFSMGGNQTLKYLGENPAIIPKQVIGCVVFSVPVLLADSGEVMDRWTNRLYMEYFMRGLRRKIKCKARMFPDLYDTSGLDAMITFAPFDDKYTGPIHGFKDARDYYHRCSSQQFLQNIEIPTLLVQAKDDPFLPPSCYPSRDAEKNAHLFLEIPRYGGHVGFVGEPGCRCYWYEERAVKFLHWQVNENRISP
ncbi:MAG: alpha/beta fold hydrolase [Desulfocapsaceae bacterium]|nr:alpha/beta fold hydrolase [Desulfocapsaceae bacterium]